MRSKSTRKIEIQENKKMTNQKPPEIWRSTINKETIKKFWETFNFEKMIDGQAPKPIREFLDGEIKFITKHIKFNSSVLEIGCGFGRLLETLSKKSNKLVGIDFSKRMIGLAKQNLADVQNVSVHLMEADELTFEDESFDYVVCLNATLGSMINIELDVLKEMKRVCKKGGEIIIIVFSENAKNAQIENYKRIGLTDIKDDGKAVHTAEGHYIRRFTKKEVGSLFNEANLKCEIIKGCSINYIAYATKNP